MKKKFISFELDGVEVIVKELPDGTNILFCRAERVWYYLKNTLLRDSETIGLLEIPRPVKECILIIYVLI